MKKIEKLYNQYSKDIYRYLISMNHNASLSEDLLSDTFVNAMMSIGNFKKQSDIKTWLFSIARYTWFGYLRKEKNNISFEELVDIYLEDDMDKKIITTEYAERVMCILDGENERSKDIVLMRIDGYSYYEIAEKHGISEGSARVIDFRMKKKIRDILIKEDKCHEENFM